MFEGAVPGEREVGSAEVQQVDESVKKSGTAYFSVCVGGTDAFHLRLRANIGPTHHGTIGVHRPFAPLQALQWGEVQLLRFPSLRPSLFCFPLFPSPLLIPSPPHLALPAVLSLPLFCISLSSLNLPSPLFTPLFSFRRKQAPLNPARSLGSAISSPMQRGSDRAVGRKRI